MLSHFGEVLAAKRKEAGLSRVALAKRIGVAVIDLSRVEGSPSLPDSSLLSKICGALSTSEDEILLAGGVIPRWMQKLLETAPKSVIRALKGQFGSPLIDENAEPAVIEGSLPKPTFQTGLGKLYQTDCLAFLHRVEDSTVDLVFADPPFNLNKQYAESASDCRSEREYMDWCVQWLGQLVRILKPGGSLFLYNIPKWNLRLGAWLAQTLEFRHWIAVDIKYSLPISGRLYPSHYALLYFSKGRRVNTFNPPRLPIETCRHCGGELHDYGGYKDRMNPRGVNITDVWTDLSPVRHARFKRRTANELPLKLLDRVLDIASKEGDLVLDPFGGSGTTFVAAELKGRRWLGSELGDCSPVVARFQRLDREREHLENLREKINILFTPDSLTLRRRFGHDTSKYRLETDGRAVSGKLGTNQLFD
jgi:site-specific DNA-methyltransferase (adenine-specific)